MLQIKGMVKTRSHQEQQTHNSFFVKHDKNITVYISYFDP